MKDMISEELRAQIRARDKSYYDDPKGEVLWAAETVVRGLPCVVERVNYRLADAKTWDRYAQGYSHHTFVYFRESDVSKLLLREIAQIVALTFEGNTQFEIEVVRMKNGIVSATWRPDFAHCDSLSSWLRHWSDSVENGLRHCDHWAKQERYEKVSPGSYVCALSHLSRVDLPSLVSTWVHDFPGVLLFPDFLGVIPGTEEFDLQRMNALANVAESEIMSGFRFISGGRRVLSGKWADADDDEYATYWKERYGEVLFCYPYEDCGLRDVFEEAVKEDRHPLSALMRAYYLLRRAEIEAFHASPDATSMVLRVAEELSKATEPAVNGAVTLLCDALVVEFEKNRGRSAARI